MAGNPGTPASKARVAITTLVREESLEWLDRLAHEHRLPRNVVVRVALAVARQNEAALTRALVAAAEAQ